MASACGHLQKRLDHDAPDAVGFMRVPSEPKFGGLGITAAFDLSSPVAATALLYSGIQIGFGGTHPAPPGAPTTWSTGHQQQIAYLTSSTAAPVGAKDTGNKSYILTSRRHLQGALDTGNRKIWRWGS